MNTIEKINNLNRIQHVELYSSCGTFLLHFYFNKVVLIEGIETPIITLEDKSDNLITTLSLDDYEFCICEGSIKLKIKEVEHE